MTGPDRTRDQIVNRQLNSRLHFNLLVSCLTPRAERTTRSRQAVRAEPSARVRLQTPFSNCEAGKSRAVRGRNDSSHVFYASNEQQLLIIPRSLASLVPSPRSTPCAPLSPLAPPIILSAPPGVSSVYQLQHQHFQDRGRCPWRMIRSERTSSPLRYRVDQAASQLRKCEAPHNLYDDLMPPELRCG